MERDTGLDSHKGIFLVRISALRGNRIMYYLSKRIIDVIVSTIALIIFSPLMFLIALLIHLDSPGPIIFKQKRVGSKRIKGAGRLHWEKTEFDFYKFRTMVDKADPAIHHNFINALINEDEQNTIEIPGVAANVKKIVNDPRVTQLGRFLRRYSLDELPQFWNVLKGDMSVVGPRPAIPYEVEMYKSWYFRRLETKPGLTGLWQVTARNSVGFDEMVKLDIKYIENQSFWLDMKIIFLTPLAMLSPKGVA